MAELDYKNIISKNIMHYRKELKLTQAELAERLNYSDKAISKWERAEAVPDVAVLNQMATIFGTKLDVLCSEHAYEKTRPSSSNSKRHLLISFMAAGLVWLVATILYVLFSMIWQDFQYFWMIFIYAIPCTAIVLIIFNKIWGKYLYSFFLSSILVWAIALCLHLSITLDNSYLFFFIAIPLQVLILLWLFFAYTKDKLKN